MSKEMAHHLSQISTYNAIRVEAVFRWNFLKSSFSKISADFGLFSNFLADFSKLGMRRIFFSLRRYSLLKLYPSIS